MSREEAFNRARSASVWRKGVNGVLETTRREMLKLAAAITAFGTTLGFDVRRAAAAEQGQVKKERSEFKFEQKVQQGQDTKKVKFERVELKFYYEGKLLHTCSAPEAVRAELKRGNRVEIKWYRDGELVSDPHM